MNNTTELSWVDWVKHNLVKNCLTHELFNILVDNGFKSAKAQSMIDTAAEQIAATDAACKSSMIDGDTRDITADLSERDAAHDVESTNRVYLPTALKVGSNAVDMYYVNGFLDTKECQHLIMLIRENRQRSTTTDEGVSEFRTSTTCALDTLRDSIVDDIDRRICQYLGIDPKQSEPIQGQWYEVGQEFKAHTDYFDPASPTFEQHVGDRGQRTWTFMIYLNTTRKGGSTYFSELGMDFLPRAGTALIWNNRDASGAPNPSTKHHGMKVQAGYKAVITKWFRSVDPLPTYMKSVNEHVAPLTRKGFIKSTIPAQLHNLLLEFYLQNRPASENKDVPEFIQGKEGKAPGVRIQLTDDLQQQVHVALQPIVEAWVGDYVTPTHVYGVCEYHHGSVLKQRRDNLETHVASVILNIDQAVSDDWPLTIEDHHYRRHSIVLKPGEMILYEGARLLHGQPSALNGTRYASVFVHFKCVEIIRAPEGG